MWLESRLTLPLLYIRARYGNLASLSRRREDLARRWLSGSGIEVGALHKPLPVPAGVRVTHVDRMSTAELQAHYPELSGLPLAPVDRVDNGERLETFADGSQNFVIGNHLRLRNGAETLVFLHKHLAAQDGPVAPR